MWKERFTPMCLGTMPPSRPARPLQRFTPMCLGTMSASTVSYSFTAVHPHVPGDNGWAERRQRDDRGSPPCAWGQCAPFTALLRPSIGSPPCAWGQLIQAVLHYTTDRFTPMCLGTMPFKIAEWYSPYGSPPCAWGQCLKLVLFMHTFSVHPHVPGDNAVWRKNLPLVTVHPHVPGDNSISPIGTMACFGSPPCAWGQCDSALHECIREPVNPHVPGDNVYRSIRKVEDAVHPHVPGDNASSRVMATPFVGSPPCAWGQLTHHE